VISSTQPPKKEITPEEAEARHRADEERRERMRHESPQERTHAFASQTDVKITDKIPLVELVAPPRKLTPEQEAECERRARYPPEERTHAYVSDADVHKHPSSNITTGTALPPEQFTPEGEEARRKAREEELEHKRRELPQERTHAFSGIPTEEHHTEHSRYVSPLFLGKAFADIISFLGKPWTKDNGGGQGSCGEVERGQQDG